MIKNRIKIYFFPCYLTDNLDHEMSHTFLLSEVDFWSESTNYIKSKALAITEMEQNEVGWEKIDIEWPVKNWVEFHSLEHAIEISCETCNLNKIPLSLEHDHKPFIVINTFPQRSLNRQARSVNCGFSSTECCRDSVYIDFSTIGWNDWIIHPKGYNAYFCRGLCNRVASITQTETHHSTILNVSFYFFGV
jgi:TGF-beta receptor, other